MRFPTPLPSSGGAVHPSVASDLLTAEEKACIEDCPKTPRDAHEPCLISCVKSIEPSLLSTESQKCDRGETHKFCLIGLANKGCNPDGTPFINCLG